jgi:hypothetical protein
MSENPFELLRLPPDASEEEIVRQGARLCQTAGDDDARNAFREAVRMLTDNAEERRLHALLTPPSPATASKELDRFVAAYRRAPASEAAEVPELGKDEVLALLRERLAASVLRGPAALEAVPDQEPAEEIARQTSEALWHSLLHDMRG